MANIPNIILKNGLKMPVLGLGTARALNDENVKAVQAAIEYGYRHIDTARIYRNEKEVGEGIQNCISKGIVKREDLFVVTKLWATDLRSERVEKACKDSLARLNLDYVDLYLIHWPVSIKPESEGKDLTAMTEADFDNVAIEDTWKSMEALVEKKLVKSIGISNFTIKQIDRIFACCKIPPVAHQIEIHVDLPNKDLVEHSMQKGMAVTAYSPIGAPHYDFERPLIKRDWICAIAEKHKKSSAQVLLRYLIQRGLTLVPKTVTSSRIVENASVFDFELSESEMNDLNNKGEENRIISLKMWSKHPEYPF